MRDRHIITHLEEVVNSPVKKTYRDFINEGPLEVMPIGLERKIKRMLHGRSYKAALAQFVQSWESDPKGHDKRDLAAKVARQYKDVDTRTLIAFIDDMAKSGKIPGKMALENKNVNKDT